MTPAVSIVIPVHDMERLLGRCLDSIIAQTFKDWEALCVDDGSTDRSSSILDEYAARDSRFVVIHQANAGAGNARNTALKHIRGRYCAMIDPDDFWHPQLLEICMHFSSRTGADMVAFTYDRRYNTLQKILQALHLPILLKPSFKKYDLAKIEYLLTDDIMSRCTELSHPGGPEKRWMVKHCQCWRTFLRSSIAGTVEFAEGIMYEDMPWWAGVLVRTRSACILNLPLYYYFPNFRGQVMQANNSYKYECLSKAIAMTDKLMSDADPRQQRMWNDNFRHPFYTRMVRKSEKMK